MDESIVDDFGRFSVLCHDGMELAIVIQKRRIIHQKLCMLESMAQRRCCEFYKNLIRKFRKTQLDVVGDSRIQMDFWKLGIWKVSIVDRILF